ncbi:MAG: exodeoxyribonuclease VII small subunit [Brevibacterium sp.]|uniref:exodeoxyribonuclease VII small subunit n=1 Tax=Brevibacterium sp. TaxID=1701 RepID=UPI00264949F3|nr:exodeoxyribonuclease VII small subunit [Brevibacterium sp.]MDN5806251.1 exodeoxyribonuclease VII small subunit [Brevibacterium sp.]MDN5832779.1 exodeoxyribonuclease VII small subunit [Brevibacterium sp.]MDN5875386.1 exodeoxyribonuclease VII small subunit [Brevibacterium sp.]MDN5908581.1 exodeoxyribonuclease VII small subunit [Brevibacterium sp.]MDN6133064.1 exodeoxyribonuclease VII small subunit [Brevibacterium sp.]
MTEPTTQQNQADISSLSYEQAREELVGIVKRLEAGNLPLEDSLRLWERGEALADRCQGWLDGARERLDKAREDSSDDED